MKAIVVLCAVIGAAVAFPGETYNPAYDNFNAKELAENPRILKNYGKCFLDQGPCTAEGLDFKKVMPEAIRTSCGKCTPKQRELVRIVIQAFKTQQPEMWNELVNKLDPQGQYTDSFNKFLSATD